MAFKYIFCIPFLAVCCNAIIIRGGLQPKFEALYPRGLRVTLPDDGFTLFGFRGNLNKELDGLEAEKWVKDVHGKTNGEWVFLDRKVRLEEDDTIYYWIFVMKNGALYREGPQEWVVTEFVNEDGSPVKTHQVIVPPPEKPNLQNRYPPPTNVAKPTEASSPPPCDASRTVVMGKNNICRGDLIFNEEFDKNNMAELAFWDPEVKFPLEPDYPFNVYMDDGTLRLENGRLIVSPLLLESKYHEGFVREELDLTNRCTGLTGTLECQQTASGAQILPPVITGKVTTKNKFNFKFGRVEVRAKLPRGNWLVPEITLEPRDSVHGKQRFQSGLMRVAFVKGNDVFSKKLVGGPILYDSEPYRSQFMKEKFGNENWNRDFHNYTMLWKPDGLEWFVDGESYGTIYPGDGFYSQLTDKGAKDVKRWTGSTRMTPLDEMFYVSLGLRVGGVNDFDDSLDKPWKNKNRKATINFWNAKEDWFPTWTNADLTVDYVRIYAL